MTNSTESKPSNRGLLAAAFVLVLILMGAGLFLLRDRFSGGEPAATNAVSEGEDVVAEDDANFWVCRNQS